MLHCPRFVECECGTSCYLTRKGVCCHTTPSETAELLETAGFTTGLFKRWSLVSKPWELYRETILVDLVAPKWWSPAMVKH